MNIEPLESRIAPASVLTFNDLDGDSVKITSSLGDLNGKGTFLGNIAHAQLLRLDLTDPMFQGASITTTVTKAAAGDGLVHIGRIDATGRDLGNVTIKGDLGVIDAGDINTNTVALKSLSVRSMGRFGLLTQAGGGDLQSDIQGRLGALKITGDVVGATVSVIGGGIGAVTIGGSLIGGAAALSGSITSSGDIGPVKIAGDLEGGDGVFSGAVQSAAGKIGSVSIGGSMRGGSGSVSGVLLSRDDMGAVSIGRDIQGGMGLQSAVISVGGNIQSLTVRGSVLGLFDPDAGDQNASVFCSGNLGLVNIGGDVKGGHGDGSGSIGARQKIVSVQVGGSVTGLSGDQSGAIFSNQDIGIVRVAHDLRGGAGMHSGSIFATAGKVASVTIGGSVIAALGISSVFEFSGSITSGTDIGMVRIGGDLVFGQVTAGGVAGNLGSVTIGGSISFGTVEAKGDIGAVTVLHDLRGGGIASSGDAASIRISGSLIGEAFKVSRAAQPDIPLGTILVGGKLALLRIGGDVHGGRASESAYIEADRILSATIGGSMVAGIDDDPAADFTHNASIRAGHDIGTLAIRGSLIGSQSADGITRVVISALGQEPQNVGLVSDMAIRSVTIGGRVALADILAGFGPDDMPFGGSNGNASIGTVMVGGDWIASNMSAGVVDAAGDGFANGDDYVISDTADAIVARIASITIKGVVIGSPSASVHSGFTAQQIGFFKAGLYTAPLTPATDPVILAPFTGNVAIREV